LGGWGGSKRETWLVLYNEVGDLDVKLIPLVRGPVAGKGGQDHVEDEGEARVLGDGPVGEEIIQDALISACFVECKNQKLKEKQERKIKKGREKRRKAEEEKAEKRTKEER